MLPAPRIPQESFLLIPLFYVVCPRGESADDDGAKINKLLTSY